MDKFEKANALKVTGCWEHEDYLRQFSIDIPEGHTIMQFSDGSFETFSDEECRGVQFKFSAPL